jgi:hypothetical protein
MMEDRQLFTAARRLHGYLVDTHWRDGGLYGPDPGVRLNYRIGRFLKSYFRKFAWNDDLYYLQGQGYWILANWELVRRTGDSSYRDLALECCESILQTQREDGAWDYPNREWQGRTATVEGVWASLGLMESFQHCGDERFLDAAKAWHKYLTETIGFHEFGDQLAINYFANLGDTPVPNNSADALRFFSTIANVTGDANYLRPCAGLVHFLASVQQPNGEFPYQAKKLDFHEHRPHFQCFQYNAFICLGLMRYYELTGDEAVRPIISGLLDFLLQGLTSSGAAHYECGIPYRHVTYHAAVLAAAFARAAHFGCGDYEEPAARAYEYVLSKQDSDGSLVYSLGDYRVLNDRRSYPRYLAMILYHFLHPKLRGAHEQVSAANRQEPPTPTTLPAPTAMQHKGTT